MALGTNSTRPSNMGDHHLSILRTKSATDNGVAADKYSIEVNLGKI